MAMRAPHYDVIIVGGGSAGCVLAARLTENPDRRVLLIEAGPDTWSPFVSTPTGVGMLWKKRMFDWGIDCVPCDGLNGRSIELMRGKILGGSSAINALMHVRGAPADYDRWAANGCAGWDYASVEKYFRKTESWTGVPDPRRGDSGPVSISPAETTDPLFDNWLAAAKSAGQTVMKDYNALSPGDRLIGFARNQQSVERGHRVTAKTAYLKSATKRPNLTVMATARVLNLLMQDTTASHPRVRGVRVAGKAGGTPKEIIADDRVILSAGAFHTPHLLMLSGIGPEPVLQAGGIRVVVKSDGVGENYQDHMAVQLRFERTSPGPFHGQMRMDRLAVNFPTACLFGIGPSTVVPSGVHGFVNTDRDAQAPTFQYIFRGAPGDARPWWPILSKGYQDGFGIRPVLLHPKSRGAIRLADADPRSLPRVDGRFFSEESDINTLYDGVRIAQDLSAQPAMKDYIKRGLDDFGSDKAKTLNWIRDTAVTVHHPCGTCAMGPDDVHPLSTDLSFKGVDGLYVVDASAMPGLVSGNINACVYAIAEKFAADIETST